MKISTYYLYSRHDYWRKRIADSGIWESDKFFPVTISVRPKSKTKFGMFRRRIVRNGIDKLFSDDIFLYRNCEELSENQIDNILVHEMIHQYIIQNSLHDNSQHGRLFRNFMNRINTSFPNELSLSISIKSSPVSGKGEKNHLILLTEFHDGSWLISKLDPKYSGLLIRTIKKNLKSWSIKSLSLRVSDDIYFESIRSCRTRFHGFRKKTKNEMEEFCGAHRVTIDQNLTLTLTGK